MLVYVFGVLNALKFVSIMSMIVCLILLIRCLLLFTEGYKEKSFKIIVKTIAIMFCVSMFSVIFIPSGTIAERMITDSQTTGL